ncbi:Acetyl esterase/lipase [Actinopolyspora mzabensis]|uniref:Acetyl esterase/lipase n=1 Tax=Actinopolyspora mzabensis TaxID=995066 RepID=A0A1G9ENP3_ACTMZ|nr:alpha/beta hydrolase [Actinopolyspora mzabensis]SDK77703.1 Acetyl esterase/lipase [Actinopolyspora mzabensis]
MNLDSELASALTSLPDLHIRDLRGARARMADLASNSPPPPDDVIVSEHSVPGDEDNAVPVRVFRPRGTSTPLPAVLLLHGGGFVMGSADALTAQAASLCGELPALVAAVDYRLAPEHPYPAALRDCRAALDWLVSAPEALGVDPGRVAVHGMSAGGGLAAGLTLWARDGGEAPVCFQVLDAPELDDRLETHSVRTFERTPLWNRDDAVLSWRHYLRGLHEEVPVYAAPARAAELSGLPPAYVSVYENDPLRDEGLAYASALLRAGISVELHLFPGTFHRSAVIADAGVSRRQAAETLGALRRALHPG